MKSILLIATTVALNFAALAATAAPVPDMGGSEVISFADLNLTMKSDQARLERRVRSTISRLCAGDETASPAPPPLDIKCFRSSFKDAQAQMERVVARANGGSILVAAVQTDAR